MSNINKLINEDIGRKIRSAADSVEHVVRDVEGGLSNIHSDIKQSEAYKSIKHVVGNQYPHLSGIAAGAAGLYALKKLRDRRKY